MNALCTATCDATSICDGIFQIAEELLFSSRVVAYEGKKGREREEVGRINRRGVRCHHTTTTIATQCTLISLLRHQSSGSVQGQPAITSSEKTDRLKCGSEEPILPGSQAAPVKAVVT